MAVVELGGAVPARRWTVRAVGALPCTAAGPHAPHVQRKQDDAQAWDDPAAHGGCSFAAVDGQRHEHLVGGRAMVRRRCRRRSRGVARSMRAWAGCRLAVSGDILGLHTLVLPVLGAHTARSVPCCVEQRCRASLAWGRE